MTYRIIDQLSFSLFQPIILKSMHFIRSIFKYKCPRCREGDLFIKPFRIARPLDMHERCQKCNQKTEPEPGFYFGAMFLSYILTSFPLLAIGLITVFLFGWEVNDVMIFLLIIGIAVFFKVLRFSRSLWVHLMIKYEPQNQ